MSAAPIDGLAVVEQRHAVTASSPGTTSSLAKEAGLSFPPVLTTATPDSLSVATTFPSSRSPLEVTTCIRVAPAMADTAVTTNCPPGRTTPVVGSRPVVPAGRSCTSDGASEEASRAMLAIADTDTEGMVTRLVSEDWTAGGAALIGPGAFASVRTKAAVAATAVAPNMPAAMAPRRSRQRSHAGRPPMVTGAKACRSLETSEGCLHSLSSGAIHPRWTTSSSSGPSASSGALPKEGGPR